MDFDGNSRAGSPPLPFETHVLSQDKASVVVRRQETVRSPAPPGATGSTQRVEVRAPPEDLKFGLNPVQIHPTGIVFLNASREEFYMRQLRSSSLVLWVLCDSDAIDTYSKKRLYEAAMQQRIAVKYVEANKFVVRSHRAGVEGFVEYGGEPVQLPNCCLVRLDTITPFTFTVLRYLERMGVAILNPGNAVDAALSPGRVMEEMATAGLPINKFVQLLPASGGLNEVLEFTFPVTMEEEGTGLFVVLDTVKDFEGLRPALSKCDNPLLFQESAEGSRRQEVQCLVIGGRIVASLVTEGAGQARKADVRADAWRPIGIRHGTEWIVLEAAEALGLDVVCVNVAIEGGSVKVIGVDASPEFDCFEAAAGVDVAARLIEYVTIKTGRWNKKVGHRRSEVPQPQPQPVSPPHTRLGVDTDTNPRLGPASAESRSMTAEIRGSGGLGAHNVAARLHASAPVAFDDSPSRVDRMARDVHVSQHAKALSMSRAAQAKVLASKSASAMAAELELDDHKRERFEVPRFDFDDDDVSEDNPGPVSGVVRVGGGYRVLGGGSGSFDKRSPHASGHASGTSGERAQARQSPCRDQQWADTY